MYASAYFESVFLGIASRSYSKEDWKGEGIKKVKDKIGLQENILGYIGGLPHVGVRVAADATDVLGQ
jgi:hypothetical protein